ncbi:MAG: PAS domain S-box protein [Planctomycetes bacterium]|nr:PAS domain S-box protein [Planctomycetota bacterium]
MKKFKLSLKKKALLGIVIILLPVIITFFLSYHRNKAHMEKQVLNDLTVMAEAYEGQVYQFLDMLKRRAQDFASDGFVIRHLLRKNHKVDAAVDTLSKHLVENKLLLSKYINTISVLSLDGKVVASTNSSEIGRDFSGESFFIKGRDSTAITEFNIGHGGSPELAISTPIFSKNRGRLIGVLVNFIQTSELGKVVSGEYCREMGAVSWDMGRWKTMEVYLVNKDRLMVTNSIFVKDAILKQRVDTLPIETGLTAKKEMSGFYKDYRGVEVAGVSMYIPSMQWILLVEVDADEVLVVSRDMIITAQITAVIVVGLVVLLFTVFLERVVKPLQTISSTVRNVAAGNFSTVTPVKTGDEIGTLYESFNYMVSNINARTKELEKSNARLAEAQQVAHLGNWEWDLVKNKSYWSDENYRIFGFAPQEFVVTYKTFFNCVYPDDRKSVRKSVDDTLHHKKPYDIEFRIIRKDGMVRIVHEKVEVVFDDAGRAIRMIGTVQDITEQKRTNEEMRLLQALTQAVSTSGNFHDALVIAIQKICTFTGWVYGEAWIPHTDDTSLKCNHTYYSSIESLEKFSVLTEGFIFPKGVGLPGRAWSEKQPVWVRDVTCDPHYLRTPIAREVGLKTGIAFPVIADNEVVTVVIFYQIKTEEKDERLIKLVLTVLSQIGSIIKRKQAEDELELYGVLFSEITDIAYVLDTKGNILFVNKVFEKLTGYKIRQFIGKPFAPLFDEEGQKKAMVAYTKALKGESSQLELCFENTKIICEYKSLPLRDKNNNIIGVIGTARDVTGHKQMEAVEKKLREQLYHVQKLESVGTLAGGIAHDFNNLLTAIIGYGNLLQMEMAEGIPSKDFVQKILKSAERAAKLTQGLLAFSRKQAHNPRSVYVNEIVQEVEDLLVRIIRKDIKLTTTLAGKGCIVMADVGQIEQVLMNLATNARDAMPDGGVLDISTDIVKIDDAFIKTHGYGLPGMYALITVSDTGLGIDERTKERIFEPFFTTKEVGKGTGLGLAIVYGIIKQHNGYINVYSELGKGTAFRIYLPVSEQSPEGSKAKAHIMLQEGTETILVAEDEDDVRNLARIVLERHGYKVIEAVDGNDAVEKFLENKDKVQLLLTDVIMPNKNGREAYDEIKEVRPDIKAIFMSGHSEDIANKKGILGKGFPLIAKPVSPIELLKRMREVLDK